MPDVLVRPVSAAEAPQMLAIINAAAQAYRGEIPADCWHEPYMAIEQLQAELAAGVLFTGIEIDGELVAVMGVQRVMNVHLVRHAYVVPERQGLGFGGRAIEEICGRIAGQILVGTWAAATWAISFYERHDFAMVPLTSVPLLLHTYWKIPERQVETSVVLARPHLDDAAARALVGGAGT